MRKLNFIILFLLLTFSLFAQVNLDSLEKVLAENKLQGKEKFQVYNDICYYYLSFDIEKALYYSQQALSFSQKEKNKFWISISNAYIGAVYERKNDCDTALTYYNEALRIAIEEGLSKQEAYVYVSLSSLYQRQGDITEALELSLKALSIYEKGDTFYDKSQQALILSNIGGLHRGLDNPEKAIPYLMQTAALSEELDYPQGKMKSYYDLGDAYRIMKEYDKAKEYAFKSLELCRVLGDKTHEAGNLGSLVMIYSEGFKDTENAEKCALECLSVAKELNDPYVLLFAWRILAEIYLTQGRFAESVKAGKAAWELDSTNLDQIAYVAHNLAVANIHLGNKDEAAYYMKKNVDISRQISNNNFQNTLANMEVEYETEKKEARIFSLEKERKLYVALGIAVAVMLLVLIGLLFYRHRANVQKRKMAEQQIKQLNQEKELIAARSALDAEKAEREFIARDLHDGVGAMLSVVKNNMNIMKSYSIIENSEANHFNQALDVLDKSIVELRRVAHHIMPATLIDKGLITALEDFCRSIPNVEFHAADPELRFDPERELVLYRCAYELINNALRHSGASHIEVHLNKDEKTVYLSVVDDGCGFDSEKTSMGMGLNNMRSRLEAFDGRLEIYSEEGKGTEVNIDLEITSP